MGRGPTRGTRTRVLGSLLALLRRGLVVDDDVAELHAGLRDLLGISGVAVVRGWGGMDAWYTAVGVPESWIRDHSRLGASDPSRAKIAPSPAGAWWVSERDMSEAERRREIVECFHRAGLADVAVTKLYNPLRDDLLLLLYREDRAFRPAEVQLIELLYPHLAAAMATRRALGLLQGPVGTVPPEVRVSFPAGTVSLGHAARRCIERHVGALDRAGLQKVEQGILRAAKRFSVAHVGGRSMVLWPGLRVDFAVAPARRGETMSLVGFLVEENGAVGTSDDPVTASTPALVQSLLSERQLAVASDFASGMDVPTIAESRRLSVETVRTHLRNAYRKLGAHSRHDLARALRGA